MIKVYNRDGLMWFRVFGLGLYLKDSNKMKPDFSERMGYILKVGKYLIGILK